MIKIEGRRPDNIDWIGWWTVLFFLAGIDGFSLLPQLRELGSRPFFLIFLILTFVLLLKNRLSINLKGLMVLLIASAISLFGFIIFGFNLKSFGGKSPSTQFVAQGMLFFVGFLPLICRLRKPVEENVLVRAATNAIFLHAIFVAIDFVAILGDLPRPFTVSFLGSVDRPIPTGLFSEPSYVAAYVGILLPACLYRANFWIIVLSSLIVGATFFQFGVRSFFIVYAGGLMAMTLVRWKLNLKVFLVLSGIFSALVVASLQLNVISVEDSLSSAYRLGNTISYLEHALAHDLVLGDGFGASHFLYLGLDHPAFMYLSSEFESMVAGEGFRVPIFNLWVRLFVEVGVMPTIVILVMILQLFRSPKVMPVSKIILGGALVFSLSTDSYIYGMFTLSLALVFSVRGFSGKYRRQERTLLLESTIGARNEGQLKVSTERPNSI